MDKVLKNSRFILLFSSIFCAIFVYTSAQVCNAGGLRKFDSNIAKLLTIGNSGRTFPETKGEDLKKYCEQSAEYINEIEAYKDRCMDKAGKQSAGVLIYAVKSVLIKQLCKKDSQRLTKVIAATPCANNGNAEINKCYTTLIDSMLGIQNEKDEKRKVPLLCCEYHKIFGCFESRLQRISKCDETSIATIVDFVRGITGNIIDLFCGDYTEGSDKCKILGLPPKKKTSQRRTKSFALPMIDVLKSFPEV